MAALTEPAAFKSWEPLSVHRLPSHSSAAISVFTVKVILNVDTNYV